MVKYFTMGLLVVFLLVTFMTVEDLYSDDLSDTRKKEIVAQLYNDYKKDLPGVKDIKPVEAISLIKQNKFILIDVRTPAEMDISMLPGAITKDNYLKELESYKGVIVVAYCTIGYRSGKFAEEMAAKGIEVKNLAGGLLAWVHDGKRVYHDSKEVKQIHVYGPKWNYPPSGYDTVMFNLFDRFKLI